MTEKELGQGEPAWTQQDERQGLDPLGMQNTSITLYQWLLPGISNVTLRMRYYALHTWLTDAYARAHHEPDVEEWCRFLRRAEALYALIAQYNTQDGGVAGTLWAKRKVQQLTDERVPFSANTDRGNAAQYLKQKFGAFGAAYSSQLLEVGLIEPARDHDVPIPSASGRQLAHAFGEEVGAAGQRFLEAAARGTASSKDLESLAVLAPSSIGADSQERQLYEQLLFAQGAQSTAPAARRRDTLRLILHTANELKGAPDVQDVRWISYAGYDHLGEAVAPLHGSDALHRYRWRVYQANDLTHVCHETLLRFALEVLGSYPAGLPLDALLSEMIGRLLAVPEPRPRTWAELEDSVGLTVNAWSEEPDAEWTLASALLEVRLEGALPAETAYMALRLLAILCRRMRPEREQVWQVLQPAAHPSSQTIFTEPEFLHTRGDQPIAQTLAELIKRRILDRHLAVAFQKMRAGDYTFLFEMDEGRLRLRRKAGPVLTNPRLGPAITFLHDIHLLDDDGLTNAGKQLVGRA